MWLANFKMDVKKTGREGVAVFISHANNRRIFSFYVIVMLFNVTVDGISERPPSITPSDPPFFEFFHSFINFHFAHSFITIQSCHSSLDITSFHTLWSQKLDHRLLFFFGGFCQWNNHFKRVSYYDYLEDNENPGMFCIVYIRHFSVPPTALWDKLKFSSVVYFPSYLFGGRYVESDDGSDGIQFHNYRMFASLGL